MPQTKIFISEIFKSIQGEGPKIGVPSFFLRLGICNLHCSWCDTPYTWKKGFTDYTEQTVEQAYKRIIDLKKGSKINNLVITGGEPLLQQQQLSEFLPKLKMEIEFETNGSIRLLPETSKLLVSQKISFNISPKLKDSGNKDYQINIYPNSILKFVYVNKKSENLIDNFLDKYKIKNLPIYIMPKGTTTAEMEQKYDNILKYCLKNGFNFTPRLQIYLFGNKRGT